MTAINQTVEEILEDNNFTDIVVFKDYSFDDALVGVSCDNQAIYDYDKMVEWLQNKEGWDYDTCVDWIENNTVCTLPPLRDNKPIVMNPVYRRLKTND